MSHRFWTDLSAPEIRTDVVVVGTGCAGLVAAVAAADSGARVVLVERADKVGGTTALSGGRLWLPEVVGSSGGVTGRRKTSLDHLVSLSNDEVLPRLTGAYGDAVPSVLEWIERATPLRLRAMDDSPVHQSKCPGNSHGGRSFEPELFPMRSLGDWCSKVAGRPRHTFEQERASAGGSSGLGAAVKSERRAAGLEAGGRALVGALLAAVLERRITPRVGWRARRLLLTSEHVAGLELADATGVFQVWASAVVLAGMAGRQDQCQVLRTMEPVDGPTPTGLFVAGDFTAGLWGALCGCGEGTWGPGLVLGHRAGVAAACMMQRRR